MKILVDNNRIKVTYKDGAFYDLEKNKIEESAINQIIMDLKEFKEFSQAQPEKKTKKKTKDE